MDDGVRVGAGSAAGRARPRLRPWPARPSAPGAAGEGVGPGYVTATARRGDTATARRGDAATPAGARDGIAVIRAGDGGLPRRTVAADAAPGLLDGLDGAGLVALVEQALDRLSGDAAMLVAVADAVVSRVAGQALSDPCGAVADSVAGLHRLGRRVNAELHRRVAELDGRDAWTVLRCRSAADWLSSTLALTGYEAKTIVETARVLEQLPQTATRFAAGEVDVAAVQAAAKAHAELARLAEQARLAALDDVDDGDGAGEDGGVPGGPGPATHGGDTDERDGGQRNGPRGGFGGARQELDQLIAEATGGLNRAQTRARVAGWQQQVDEQFGVEREERAWQRRGGRLSVDEMEGSGQARFDLDAAGIATVKAALEPLARKTRADDQRSYRQRLADALVAVCQRALDAPDWLPETAGGRPQVLVITTRESLDGDDPALLDGVGPVPSATARLLACDGTVTEVVVDAAGRPLQVKETGRATAAQRQAVIARDRGCVGCGAPVSHCQLHHIVFRRNHGATAVANLCLLCWGCHRKVHHHDWQVLADGGGYRVAAPWHPEAAGGIRQPAHCGRPAR